MPCRGVRGAITVEENSESAILQATRELLEALVLANGLRPTDIASVFFTATPDLDASFPARAARQMGWADVPLLDAVEMAVPGALPCCIRVLINWNTDRPAGAIHHIYLREAAVLRPDLAGGEESPMTTVAYQGEPGAYSQEAIVQQFGPGVEALACHSFDEIFAAVEGGRAEPGAAARGELPGRLDQQRLRPAARPRSAGGRRSEAARAPLPPGAAGDPPGGYQAGLFAPPGPGPVRALPQEPGLAAGHRRTIRPARRANWPARSSPVARPSPAAWPARSMAWRSWRQASRIRPTTPPAFSCSARKNRRAPSAIRPRWCSPPAIRRGRSTRR